MRQSKKIAVTGGIGSGKSTFAEILRQKGYPVFSADEINRELLTDQAYLAALRAEFPDCVKGGELDRAALSARVFGEKAALRRLNGIAHPRIMARLLEKMDGFLLSFAEVPLLYEGGYEALFDGVIALVRRREARLSSVCARDGLSEEAVLARMARQIDENALRQKNCIILENNGTEEDLRRQAEEVLKKLSL